MKQRMIRIQGGRGEFGEYTIYGSLFQFEGELRTGWRIMAHGPVGPVEQYWVEGGKFHGVGVHIMAPPTGENFIDIGGVLELDQAEAEAIETAIRQWTTEYHDTLLSEL